MLEIGVVKRLLEDKWSTYAQRALYNKLIISVIHLIFLSIAVYTRAQDTANLAVWPPTNATTWVNSLLEAEKMIYLFLKSIFYLIKGSLFIGASRCGWLYSNSFSSSSRNLCTRIYLLS
jgi:hypothetical protein